MEKTKKQIEQYFDSKIRDLSNKKKSAGTDIVKIAKQSQDVIKFSNQFSFDIENIISNNGIKSKIDIDELKSFANKIYIDRLKEYVPILGSLK
jgi:hypothetical protein